MNVNGTTGRCARLGCGRPPRDLFHRAHRDRDLLDGPRYCGVLECHAYVPTKGGEAWLLHCPPESKPTPDREVAPRTYGEVYIPPREKETPGTPGGMSVRHSASNRADAHPTAIPEPSP